VPTRITFNEGNCCKPVQLDERMGDDDLITFNINEMQPPTSQDYKRYDA